MELPSNQLQEQTLDNQDIVGAYHIAMMGNWRKVVAEQSSLLDSSGLLARTKTVLCGVVGGRLSVDDLPMALRKKAHIECDTDLKRYEFFTLEQLHKQSMCARFKAWYIHTKGVSYPQDAFRSRWRRLMEHFIIRRHKDCIDALNRCDACGINLIANPYRYTALFFGGNFWWANSEYIARLPSLNDFDTRIRYLAEIWIGLGHGKFTELFNRWDFLNPKAFDLIPRYLENGAYWDGEKITQPKGGVAR